MIVKPVDPWSAQKKWATEHPDRVAEIRRKYRAKNPPAEKEWYENNKERLKGVRKKYYEGNKEKLKEARKRWRAKNAGRIKETQGTWNKKNAGRVRELGRKWRKEHPESIRATKARRRSYGYNMLNTYSSGLVGHHINDMDVVFIPEDIHRGCYYRNDIGEHRRRVLDYYGSVENMIEGVVR